MAMDVIDYILIGCQFLCVHNGSIGPKTRSIELIMQNAIFQVSEAEPAIGQHSLHTVRPRVQIFEFIVMAWQQTSH